MVNYQPLRYTVEVHCIVLKTGTGNMLPVDQRHPQRTVAVPVAFSLALEKSSIGKPWTISHLPPLHLTGKEKMMSCNQQSYLAQFHKFAIILRHDITSNDTVNDQYAWNMQLSEHRDVHRCFGQADGIPKNSATPR